MDVLGGIDKGQLRFLVAETVRDVIREEMGDLESLLNAAAAAELVGCTVAQLRRLAIRGTIPSIEMGRRRRYRRSALLAYRSRQEKGGR